MLPRFVPGLLGRRGVYVDTVAARCEEAGFDPEEVFMQMAAFEQCGLVAVSGMDHMKFTALGKTAFGIGCWPILPTMASALGRGQ
eukprot:10608526-Lingulodinium_polyedra.AAC.1